MENKNTFKEERFDSFLNKTIILSSKDYFRTQMGLYNKEKRKQIQFNHSVDALTLKSIHNQASIALSKRKYLTNESYRKWNYSAYKYNPSKKRYEFNEELGRSYDVPKYIKER